MFLINKNLMLVLFFFPTCYWSQSIFMYISRWNSACILNNSRFLSVSSMTAWQTKKRIVLLYWFLCQFVSPSHTCSLHITHTQSTFCHLTPAQIRTSSVLYIWIFIFYIYWSAFLWLIGRFFFNQCALSLRGSQCMRQEPLIRLLLRHDPLSMKPFSLRQQECMCILSYIISIKLQAKSSLLVVFLNSRNDWENKCSPHYGDGCVAVIFSKHTCICSVFYP